LDSDGDRQLERELHGQAETGQRQEKEKEKDVKGVTSWFFFYRGRIAFQTRDEVRERDNK
jgi:hypothetical protein